MTTTPWQQLLVATIERLEELREHGMRYVPVDSRQLDSLTAASKPVMARSRTGSSAEKPAEKTPRIPPKTVPVAVPPTRPAPVVTVPDPAPAPAGPELSREEKLAAMDELRQRATVCQKCPHLAASRRNVVFGVGDIYSPLMFVGEAPGADEDVQGEPFVGAAGQLLTKIIHAMGLSRDTVYIANVLKCRPDTPGQLSGNRKPTPNEMKTCLPFLLAQIDIIRPKVIVALGATALEGLLGLTGITRLRGHFQTFRGTPLMPTYHPSYLLRNQTLAVKRQVWEDMLQVMERLSMPISEKQRAYFLRPAGGPGSEMAS